MSQPIRAVYSEGQLRLLDPVNLNEGQEIQLVILSDEERVRAALGDLLVEYDESTGDVDEDALMSEIEAGLRGQSLSEAIIEERREGPMSYYFLDSSALVKRYVTETGTWWIRSLVTPQAGHRILIAQVTPVEIVSGTMRRQRENTITLRVARAIRLLVDRHAQREYLIVELTEQISRRAENLLEVHALRAYDAVQLASALESNSRLVAAALSPLIFISADNRLLATAALEGLVTNNPNTHP